jgi:hypothetical protein
MLLCLLVCVWVQRRQVSREGEDDYEALKLRRLVLAGGVVALLAYMLRAGALTAARLSAVDLACVFLAVIPALHRPRPQATRTRGWLGLCWMNTIVAVMALLTNPTRPLLPVQQVIQFLPERFRNSPLALKAVQTVTVVPGHLYAYDSLKYSIPPGTREVSGVFERDDLEGQLWIRFHLERVTSILDQRDLGQLTERRGEIVIANASAVSSRFGLEMLQFAERIGAKILGHEELRISNTLAPRVWYVLQVQK